jgi:hypothetical protein
MMTFEWSFQRKLIALDLSFCDVNLLKATEDKTFSEILKQAIRYDYRGYCTTTQNI